MDFLVSNFGNFKYEMQKIIICDVRFDQPKVRLNIEKLRKLGNSGNRNFEIL